MSKQWVMREKVSSDLVRQILFYRGVKEEKEIEKFLNPDYEKGLYDPFLMLGMDKAVKRILRALKDNERIVVFGDYDADGVCASVIFHDFFKKIGFKNFHFHIGDRQIEGYGLNSNAVEEFISQKTNMVITVDCGVTDHKEIEKLNNSGIDVIVLDHHLVPEKPPRALVIVNAKQKKDKYPFKDLCGAGLAFKTVQALVKKGDFKIVDGWGKWLLDLVVLASVADMVPLVDENRVLVCYGLQVLRKARRQGIISLLRRLNMAPANINEDDIAFMIAPRINISSRMEHANTSFELLITESGKEADWITGRMEVMIAERKFIVNEIFSEICEKMDKRENIPDVVVVGNIKWRPGVLGLAASKVIEKYKRPVFIWGKGESIEIKGSCRSDGSVNVVELMNAVKEKILIHSGGHSMAGGYSVNEEKINDLEKEILTAFKKVPKKKIDNEILHIDMELHINEVNEETYSMIEKLGPFGMGNPKPVFLFKDLEIFNVRKFGNGGIHLQLDFKKSDGIISAISFFANGNGVGLKAGNRIDLVANLEKSYFRATPELRLRIVDIGVK